MARRARPTTASNEEGTEREDEERDRRGAGPTRGLWSGSISFGLLQIPVTLYTAQRRAQEIHFHLLDKTDLSRVRYERVNANTGKPVEWGDIVKGYEIEPDEYVVMDPDDLKKANVKATQTIDIQDFVPRGQIDPAFFDTPYYLAPQRRATKAYVLLRQALENKDAVAIASFVLRTREHLAAIMPVGDALMLETLRFDHELRRADEMPVPHETPEQANVSGRELAMAEQLVSGMLTDFRPSKYKDRYYADVMQMIEEKARTGAAKARHTRAPGRVATDVVDLLDLLKKSVAQKPPAANDQRRRGATTPSKAKKRSRKKTEAA